MVLKIEFLGLPGSGKSFFFKKLQSLIKIYKINLKIPIDIIIENYLKKKTKTSNFKKKLYSYYINLVQLNSKKLFKKEAIELKSIINHEILKRKKIKKLIKLYTKYSSNTYIPKRISDKMVENFKVDCLGHFLATERKENLISEEGFFQKIFLNFKYKKNKFLRKDISNFLSLIPKPNIILYFNTNIEKCIERTNNRRSGFSYVYNKKYILNEKNNFNNYVLEYAKKNKIKVFKINTIGLTNKKVKKIIKVLNINKK